MLFTYFRFPYTTTETVRDVLCWCGVRVVFVWCLRSVGMAFV